MFDVFINDVNIICMFVHHHNDPICLRKKNRNRIKHRLFLITEKGKVRKKEELQKK